MAESTERGITTYKARDGQEIRLGMDIIKRYLVSGKAETITEAEAMFFMGVCKSRGLNPFKKDCYLIKYSEHENAAIVVSIDYFRSRARAQPDCVGWESGILVQARGVNVIVYRKGAMLFPGDVLLGGWFRARPKGWEVDYEWTVPLAAYIKKTKDGHPTKFWSEDNQPMQIAKVAESQGLRHVWTDEFQSLYTEEEINSEQDVTPLPPPPVDKPKLREPRAKEQPPPQAVASVASNVVKAERLPEKLEADPRQTTLDNVGDGNVFDIEPDPDNDLKAEQPTPIELAREWVESLTTFDARVLGVKIKDLNMRDQVTICTRFNERKKLA